MDLGLPLAALITVAPGLVGLVMQKRSKERQERMRMLIDGVRKDVATSNDLSLGALAANTETRRIEGIPIEERTPTEQHHVDDAPPLQPPVGVHRPPAAPPHTPPPSSPDPR